MFDATFELGKYIFKRKLEFKLCTWEGLRGLKVKCKRILL